MTLVPLGNVICILVVGSIITRDLDAGTRNISSFCMIPSSNTKIGVPSKEMLLMMLFFESIACTLLKTWKMTIKINILTAIKMNFLDL
jgi:hypothetical protein